MKLHNSENIEHGKKSFFKRKEQPSCGEMHEVIRILMVNSPLCGGIMTIF